MLSIDATSMLASMRPRCSLDWLRNLETKAQGTNPRGLRNRSVCAVAHINLATRRATRQPHINTAPLGPWHGGPKQAASQRRARRARRGRRWSAHAHAGKVRDNATRGVWRRDEGPSTRLVKCQAASCIHSSHCPGTSVASTSATTDRAKSPGSRLAVRRRRSVQRTDGAPSDEPARLPHPSWWRTARCSSGVSGASVPRTSMIVVLEPTRPDNHILPDGVRSPTAALVGAGVGTVVRESAGRGCGRSLGRATRVGVGGGGGGRGGGGGGRSKGA